MALAGSASVTPATNDSKVGSSPATSHVQHSQDAAQTNEVRPRMIYLTKPRVRLRVANTYKSANKLRELQTEDQLEAVNSS